MTPTRCICGDPLIIHCGSHTCTWLRCPNAGCVVLAVDVEHERHTEVVG